MRPVHFISTLVLLLLASASVTAERTPHQPMLASVYSGEAHSATRISEYWVSEKLDGVRGHWDGQQLWTRGGYPIATPGWFTAGWPGMSMDGELWTAREQFDSLSGIVRSANAPDSDWRRVSFRVFDLPGHGGAFTERVEIMRSFSNLGIAWLQPVHQFRVADVAELDQHLHQLVAAGAEGLMLHHESALYRSGRTQDLLKYKLHDDDEARVVGYTDGKGKYAGLVGALIVEHEDGRRFRLGSGLSDADRSNPPPMGSWVNYRYNGLTSTGLPRFARFMRIRADVAEMDASGRNIPNTRQ
ncbi:MAG: DNA ligase [Pseudoalteromonas distincta]